MQNSIRGKLIEEKDLQTKINEFFDKTTPEQIIEKFENLGYKFINTNEEIQHLEQPKILKDFITAIKEEFPNENWDYLDFVADRVITQQ